MKKLLPGITIFLFSFLILVVPFSKAATYTITAADFQFSPDTLDILVGDTIHWEWGNGIHTTTSNGIPEDALVWNELLDSAHTSFTYVVTVPGTYHYLSVPDLPGMQGEFTATLPIGIFSPDAFGEAVNIFPTIIDNYFHLSFQFPVMGKMVITLYDGQGRRLENVFEGNAASLQDENYYLHEKYPPGYYFINIRLSDLSMTKKILLK